MMILGAGYAAGRVCGSGGEERMFGGGAWAVVCVSAIVCGLVWTLCGESNFEISSHEPLHHQSLAVRSQVRHSRLCHEEFARLPIGARIEHLALGCCDPRPDQRLAKLDKRLEQFRRRIELVKVYRAGFAYTVPVVSDLTRGGAPHTTAACRRWHWYWRPHLSVGHAPL